MIAEIRFNVWQEVTTRNKTSICLLTKQEAEKIYNLVFRVGLELGQTPVTDSGGAELKLQAI